MNLLMSAIDKYLSPSIDEEEEEELVFHDICIICKCTLSDDKYDQGVFYDDMGAPHHLTCSCIIHSHQTCIETWVKRESTCPQCEQPLKKTPFFKTMWIFIARFFETNRLNRI